MDDKEFELEKLRVEYSIMWAKDYLIFAGFIALAAVDIVLTLIKTTKQRYYLLAMTCALFLGVLVVTISHIRSAEQGFQELRDESESS